MIRIVRSWAYCLLAGSACLAAAWYLFGKSTIGSAKTDPSALAKSMLDSLGSQAGLCVHLGPHDGSLTTQLSGGGQYLVHGLCRDQRSVNEVRKMIEERSLAGVVSVESSPFDRLPYADRIVNLIVVDDGAKLFDEGLTLEEILRVLRPGGVAWIGHRQGDSKGLLAQQLTAKLASAKIEDFEFDDSHGLWARFVNPRPATMDQWTHKRYDPSGNPVSKDVIIGLPSGVRWVAGPNWPTGHRKTSIPGVVASKDRLVYIFQDEQQTRAGPRPHDSLVARDAYNGLVLWKRETTKRSTALVSVGDRVYTVLEDDGPLVALDAANGETVQTFPETVGPQQVVYVDDSLLVDLPNALGCYDAKNGKLVWRTSSRPTSFLAGDGKVFVHSQVREKSGERVSQFAALDLKTGQQRWAESTKSWSKRTPKLILYQKGVLVAAADDGNHAFSANNGSHLWHYKYPRIGHGGSYEKIMYMDDLVWVHTAAFDETKRYAWEGLDPRTGQVQKRLIQPKDFVYKHRCSYDVATERYFMLGSMDFCELETGNYEHFSAGRNSCRTGGLVPANGLIYTFPHACGCYPMLRGFLAFTTTPQPDLVTPETATRRLEKGPAYADLSNAASALSHSQSQDWPTYRHDSVRSGSTSSNGPTKLDIVWKNQVAKRIPEALAAEWDLKDGGRLSSPVIANGLALAAATDDHRVAAYDATSGQQRWTFTAGGRVDCPPTIYQGLCLFGCRDGWVYCLRVADGSLIWRFQAAPDQRKIVAYGQLESPWPIVGGVLIMDDLACFVAGRHAGSDGGVLVHAVEPETGKLVWARRPKDYPGVPDVLTGADGTVQMASWTFDSKTGDHQVASESRLRGGRLGLLNDAWYHRPIALRKNLQLWSADDHGDGQLISFSKQVTAGYKASRSVDGNIGKLAGNATLFAIHEDRKLGKNWQVTMPNTARPRGIVIAGDRLYVAGLLGAGDSLANVIRSYSLANGQPLEEFPLQDQLVHDCLAVANDRLYVSTQSGRLICLGEP